MGEWLKPAVLKTVSGVTRSGVRIPLPPPAILLTQLDLLDRFGPDAVPHPSITSSIITLLIGAPSHYGELCDHLLDTRASAEGHPAGHATIIGEDEIPALPQ